jgi:hypothetical protein
MPNCGLLLNDGTSFIELNAGGFILLNDSSCDVEPGGGEAEPTGGGPLPSRRGRLQLYKKKKQQDVPPNLVDRLLDLPEDVSDVQAQQAFALENALKAAELALRQEELLRIQQHQALLLKEDEELIWLLMME